MSDFDFDPDVPSFTDDVPVVTEGNSTEAPERSSSPSADASNKVDVINVDLTVTEFAPVKKLFEEKPSALFDSPDYYKKVLSGEGQAANRLHGLLSKYLAAKDAKDKSVFRQQIISAYWELAGQIATEVSNQDCRPEKKAALRFGLILTSLLTAEQKMLFATIVEKNETGEPIYYLDEWFSAIAYGKIALRALTR